MAKVQFNCRLDEETRDRIVAIAESRGDSQADVIALAVAALDMQAAQGRVEARPRKQSKNDARVAALKASDPMGAERGDIDFGNMELPSGGSVSVVGAAIPVVRQRASGGKSDAYRDRYRGPLLKPSAGKR